VRRRCRHDRYAVVINQELIQKHCRKHKSSMNETYKRIEGSIDKPVATTGTAFSVVLEQDTDLL
jgi:hypothetical protein